MPCVTDNFDEYPPRFERCKSINFLNKNQLYQISNNIRFRVRNPVSHVLIQAFAHQSYRGGGGSHYTVNVQVKIVIRNNE